MTLLLPNKVFKKYISLFLILSFSIFSFSFVFADEEVSEDQQYYDQMEDSIKAISSSYDVIETRIEKTKDGDTRDKLDAFKKENNDPIIAFKDINIKDSSFYEDLEIKSLFFKYEKAAQKALSDINFNFISPTEIENVPKGDIVQDFIPQLIRQLFRFTSVAILISFIVSGVMLVTASDDEEKLSKAKRILYYSLIGFAFVTFAFAIVKAITNINFF